MDSYALTVQTFDRHAAAYDERFSQHQPYLESYRRFCELLSLEKPTVLDVGCGPGIFSNYILQRFPGTSLTGLDLSPRMLELARRKNPEARFECLDARRFAETGNGFDIVLFAFCFPYLNENDVLAMIENIDGLLNRGGWVYISLIEGCSDGGAQQDAHGNGVAQYYHSPARLLEALCAIGLEVIEEHTEQLTGPDGHTEQELFLYLQRKS